MSTYAIGSTFEVTVPWRTDPMTLTIDDGTVAVMLDAETGAPADIAQSWETVQSMVNSGEYLAVAVRGDGPFETVDSLQAMADHERELYVDCFGE